MDRRTFLSGVAGGLTKTVGPAQAHRPNIVLILADDLGFGSLNCYGADARYLRTPNIDRLAHEGVRFTDANTPSSVCTPTRYGLLTGRYCWRTTLKSGVLATGMPLHIETNRLTLASLLKRRGYRTAAIGKWHLGYGNRPQVDFTARLRPGPLQLGFDYHFAVPLDRVPTVRRQEMAPQLYDLRQDPGESHNLLPRRPEVAAELKELLNTHRAAGHTRTV